MGQHLSNVLSFVPAAASPQFSPSPDSPPSPNIVLKHAVVLQGLEGSGKSTVQSSLGLPSSRVLSLDDRFLTTPQIFSTHRWRNRRNRISNRPHDFGDKEPNKDLWRYGGRGSLTPRWATIARRTQAIIFVVDSTDHARIAPSFPVTFKPMDLTAIKEIESREEQAVILADLKKQMNAKNVLKTTLHELTLPYSGGNSPLLVLATKQDLKGAMSVEDICNALDMKSIVNRDWHTAGINAVSGEGLQEAVDWLNHAVQSPTEFAFEISKVRKEIETFEQRMAHPHRTFLSSKQHKINGKDNKTPIDDQVIMSTETFGNKRVFFKSPEIEQNVMVQSGSDPVKPWISAQIYPSPETSRMARGSKRKLTQVAAAPVELDADESDELSDNSPADVTMQQETISAQTERDVSVLIQELSTSPDVPTMKKMKFTGIGSTSLALPHHSDIPVAPQVLCRKRWLSREWVLKDAPNYGTKDIHSIYWWH